MDSWQGQVAVVTGAASGIGRGLARHCLGLGMTVIATDVDGAGLDDLSRSCDGAARLATHIVDVSDEAAVEALAQRVFDQHGRVNLLFNNAGVLVDGKSWERSSRDWRWLLDVNVMGVVHGIRAFVPRMLKQGEAARVVNTSSIGGLLGGGAYMALYQGTKHMVTAISESLFQELALEPEPVSVSVLCPAEVATGIWESDRLRPEAERNVLGSEAEQQTHDMIAQGVAAGLNCDEFSQRVFEGIDAGKFWLLPQPDFKPMFAARTESIMDETQPRSMMELLGLR
ncbi:MAG: SDR family NAD(P)-dependent oxidoreductase [Pseudomonadota bacterium]